MLKSVISLYIYIELLNSSSSSHNTNIFAHKRIKLENTTQHFANIDIPETTLMLACILIQEVGTLVSSKL